MSSRIEASLQCRTGLGCGKRRPRLAQPTDGARVFLVLDASGSMWGRVGNQTKIEVARETIRTLLKDWRRAGPARADDLRPSPQGRLRRHRGAETGRAGRCHGADGAGERHRAQGHDADDRLGEDGGRTAQGERRHHQRHPGVRRRRDLQRRSLCGRGRPQEGRRAAGRPHRRLRRPGSARPCASLECMAAATGGLALSASNAGELGSAIGRAVEAARKKAPPAAPPPPAPKAEPKPAWNCSEGSARLAEGDDPLAGKDSVVWKFDKPAPAGVAPDYVDTSYKDRIEAELAPGDYLVEVDGRRGEVQDDGEDRGQQDEPPRRRAERWPPRPARQAHGRREPERRRFLGSRAS